MPVRPFRRLPAVLAALLIAQWSAFVGQPDVGGPAPDIAAGNHGIALAAIAQPLTEEPRPSEAWERPPSTDGEAVAAARATTWPATTPLRSGDPTVARTVQPVARGFDARGPPITA